MNRSTILAGHYLPYDSPIHRLDPRMKLISLIILLAAVIITRSAPGYVLLGIFLFSLSQLSKTGFGMIFRSIRQVGPFLLFIFLMNALFFNGEHLLWRYAIFHVSVGGSFRAQISC